MTAVSSTRARCSVGPDPGPPARVWTSGNPGAIGPFGFTMSLVNRRRGRQKGGHPNEYPHAGMRVAGD
jgi:hypothetical protein